MRLEKQDPVEREVLTAILCALAERRPVTHLGLALSVNRGFRSPSPTPAEVWRLVHQLGYEFDGNGHLRKGTKK